MSTNLIQNIGSPRSQATLTVFFFLLYSQYVLNRFHDIDFTDSGNLLLLTFISTFSAMLLLNLRSNKILANLLYSISFSLDSTSRKYWLPRPFKKYKRSLYFRRFEDKFLSSIYFLLVLMMSIVLLLNPVVQQELKLNKSIEVPIFAILLVLAMCYYLYLETNRFLGYRNRVLALYWYQQIQLGFELNVENKEVDILFNRFHSGLWEDLYLRFRDGLLNNFRKKLNQTKEILEKLNKFLSFDYWVIPYYNSPPDSNFKIGYLYFRGIFRLYDEILFPRGVFQNNEDPRYWRIFLNHSSLLEKTIEQLNTSIEFLFEIERFLYYCNYLKFRFKSINPSQPSVKFSVVDIPDRQVNIGNYNLNDVHRTHHYLTLIATSRLLFPDKSLFGSYYTTTERIHKVKVEGNKDLWDLVNTFNQPTLEIKGKELERLAESIEYIRDFWNNSHRSDLLDLISKLQESKKYDFSPFIRKREQLAKVIIENIEIFLQEYNRLNVNHFFLNT